MAIDVKCDRCNEELDTPGALFFTRPDTDGRCRKHHLCAVCALEVIRVISTPPKKLSNVVR